MHFHSEKPARVDREVEARQQIKAGHAPAKVSSSDDTHNSQDKVAKWIEGETVEEKRAEAMSTLKGEDCLDSAVKVCVKSLKAGIQNGLSLADGLMGFLASG
jgi:hypothetical protein